LEVVKLVVKEKKRNYLSLIIKKNDKYGHYGFIFIITYFIFLSLFVIYPIVYSLRLSFTRWDGYSDPVFIGLDNFTRLIKDPYFYDSILNTVIMWTGCIIPQMIIGLFLAVILTSWKIRGTSIFRALFYLPNLITMAAIGSLFWFIFDGQSGVLNIVLLKLNIIDSKINWLKEAFYVRSIVSLALWWMWYGYTMIIFMAGIKYIPVELYEAAKVDGANRWQSFKNITVPLLKPIFLYQTVTSLIGGLTIFDIPYVFAGPTGGVEKAAQTTVMYLYDNAFVGFSGYGYASAIGVGLFVISIVFVLIAFRLMYKDISHD
jgi:multiple sugar transport system permease protein